MPGIKLQIKTCEYCRKKSMTPCETQKNASKCTRNRIIKQALVNRKDDTRGK